MTFLKYTLFAFARDIVYAPIWWYTGGAVFIYKWLVSTSASTWHSVGLAVWIKNIFTPMFQQYDWQGRIISFFMRLFQIIFRFVGFTIIFVLYLAAFLGWFLLPVLAIMMIFNVMLTSYIPTL